MPERGSFGLFGVQEAARIVNGKALSKACIHRENELKTRPMDRDSIYTEELEYTRMFKEALVNVFRMGQKTTEATGMQWKWAEDGRRDERKQECLCNVKLLYWEVAWRKEEERKTGQSVTDQLAGLIRSLSTDQRENLLEKLAFQDKGKKPEVVDDREPDYNSDQGF